MARDFRRPERRQAFLLPPDMQDWVPQDDIVHLVLDPPGFDPSSHRLDALSLSRQQQARAVAPNRPDAVDMTEGLTDYLDIGRRT